MASQNQLPIPFSLRVILFCKLNAALETAAECATSTAARQDLRLDYKFTCNRVHFSMK